MFIFDCRFWAGLMLITACTNEHLEPSNLEDIPQVIFQYIDIQSPVADSAYVANDTVWMEGLIVYELGLHGYQINLYNTTRDTVVYFDESHIHADTIPFSHFWVNDVDTISMMDLSISAVLDHDGKTETEHVHFQCLPL